MRRVLGPLMFLLLLIPVASSQGVRSAQTDLDHLVHTAQSIVRGRVVSAKVEPHPQLSNLQTLVVTISVSKTFKGESSPTLTFRQFLIDPQDARFFSYKQDEILLFLNPPSPYGLTSPVGLDQGRFRILRDPRGVRFATNGRGNLGLFHAVEGKAASRGVTFSSQVHSMLSKPAGPAPLDTLESAIQALAGAPQ
jgi:hypothetical protein